MESQSAGFPPFPHSLEIPSGFPHFHGLGYDEISIEKQRQSPAVNHKLSPQLRKGLVTDVPGPICNACPGTLNPLAAFAFVVAVAVAFQPIREGRCGEGTAPLRWVAEDCKAGRRQGGYLLPPKTALGKPEAPYVGNSTGMNCEDEKTGRKAKLRLHGPAKRKECASIEMYSAVI